MNDEMDEIISEFITEAVESLDKIEPLFVELEQKGEDKDLLNDIFRSMHTIKGAAGFLGFQSIVDVAHSSENIMKKLRDNEIKLSKELMDAILKSVDMLRVLLVHLQNKDEIEEDVSPLVSLLKTSLDTAMSLSGNTEKDGQPAAQLPGILIIRKMSPQIPGRTLKKFS
jgi:two-component system chemotaxis sensor kinase CheA